MKVADSNPLLRKKNRVNIVSYQKVASSSNQSSVGASAPTILRVIPTVVNKPEISSNINSINSSTSYAK